MKKYAIISTNEMDDYLFHIPLTVYSWNKQGFDCVIYYDAKDENIDIIKKYCTNCHFIKIPDVYYNEVPKRVTIIQTIRLYGYQLDFINEDDYVILGDADMFICNDFLNNNYDKINVHGFDITGRTEIPMCYVGMSKKMWRIVLRDSNIIDDIKTLSKYQSEKFEEWWGVDQQILTTRLKQYGFDKLNFIDRGFDQILAQITKYQMVDGRLARPLFLKPTSPIKDCHSLKDILKLDNYNKVVNLFKELYPNDNLEWIKIFYDDYVKNKR